MLDLGSSDDAMSRLFGEGPGGFVVSGHPGALARLAERVPLDVIGVVGGDALHLVAGGEEIEASLGELREAHGSLARSSADYSRSRALHPT